LRLSERRRNSPEEATAFRFDSTYPTPAGLQPYRDDTDPLRAVDDVGVCDDVAIAAEDRSRPRRPAAVRRRRCRTKCPSARTLSRPPGRRSEQPAAPALRPVRSASAARPGASPWTIATTPRGAR
jgi:hypothetical protein